MHVANTEQCPPTSVRLTADLDLVGRAARGEAAAFELIMRRHNRLLFRSARGVVRDDAEAQDVVQETYLRAFLMLNSFRGESALGTWLARIAINVALDVQRRRGRAVRLDDSEEAASDSAMVPMTAVNAPVDDSPDMQAERSQARARLQAAIDDLPAIYRSVFILRAVEEMSVDETASCLQVSDAVVKTRYLRARSMLRDALGAQANVSVRQTYSIAGAHCNAVVAHVLAELRRKRRICPDGPG